MNHSTVLEEAEDKKMKSESSKSRFLLKIPVKPRTPQVEIAESCNKLAEIGFGHGKNHTTSLEKRKEEEEEVKKTQIEEEKEVKKTKIEEEEVKKTKIDESFRPSKMREYYKRKETQSASEKKNTILDDKEEELEKMRSKRRNLDGELRTPQTQIAEKSRIGSSTDGKKNTILDDKEEELEKMRSKRRNLDGESTTPQAQTAETSRIGSSTDGKKLLEPAFGYSIDGESRTLQTQIAGKSRIGSSSKGKKLLEPAFGYSIDGKKLPKHPQIEGLSEIIGVCSDPFEKKLLKTDVDRIILERNNVNKGICPYLTKDEKAKLTKGGILVNTYDEFGFNYQMKFESYHNCYYKLCDGWKRLWKMNYKNHKLNDNEDCYVAVWMFRHKHTDEVCFAVTVKVQD